MTEQGEIVCRLKEGHHLETNYHSSAGNYKTNISVCWPEIFFYVAYQKNSTQLHSEIVAA